HGYGINAKDFGATCNGSADDSTALAKALALAAGGTLVIPANCAHASTLAIPANTVVQGLGKDGTGQLTYTGSGVQLTITGSNSAVFNEIRDLILSSTGGTAAIKTSQAREIAIRRVYVKGNSTGYSTAMVWLS